MLLCLDDKKLARLQMRDREPCEACSTLLIYHREEQKQQHESRINSVFINHIKAISHNFDFIKLAQQVKM